MWSISEVSGMIARWKRTKERCLLLLSVIWKKRPLRSMQLMKRTPNAYGWSVNGGHAWPNRERCWITFINKLKRWTIEYTQTPLTLCRWFAKTQLIDRIDQAWPEREHLETQLANWSTMKRRSIKTPASISHADDDHSSNSAVSFWRSDMIWYCLSVLIRIVWTVIFPQQGYIHPVRWFRWAHQ